MKFQVSKLDLNIAISTVGGARNSTEGDISSHLLFRVKPGTTDQVEILAASNRIYANCTIPKVQLIEAGDSFTIEGWRLKGWIGTVGDTALEFETLANAEVSVKAGKYTQRFRSLDPNNFNYMDKTLAGSESKGKIQSKRLSHALKIASMFTSNDDANKADVVVVDVTDGMMVATDKSSVVVFFSMKDLPECSMRIHTKDVSGVCGFLDQIDCEVEILDAKRIVFIRRSVDNAVYGETRYQINFPKLSPPDSSNQRVWSVKTGELRRAAQHGHFGARKDDKRLFFFPPDSEGRIRVSMKTDTNLGAFTHVFIDCAESGSGSWSYDVLKDGFPVSYDHMMAIIDAFPGDDTIQLGVVVPDSNKNKVYIRVSKDVFTDDKGGCDKYVFVMTGMVV